MEVATHSGRQGEQVPPAGAYLFLALLLGTMAIQGNVQPRCGTKYKTYGGALCSMAVALVLPPL
jgi:hypothetical protein